MYRCNADIAHRIVRSTSVNFDRTWYPLDLWFAHTFKRFTWRFVQHPVLSRAIGQICLRAHFIANQRSKDGERSEQVHLFGHRATIQQRPVIAIFARWLAQCCRKSPMREQDTAIKESCTSMSEPSRHRDHVW